MPTPGSDELRRKAHKTDIVGNYFQKGYRKGVDYVISQGIVDSTKMGVLGGAPGVIGRTGFSTHTNRFQRRQHGAGTSNWISMYAERTCRETGSSIWATSLPYDDFDAYWNQSTAQVHQERENRR